MSSKQPPGGYSPFWIVSIYALFGSFWVLFSDQLLQKFTKNPDLLTQLQTVKGWAYVFLTSGLLYGLIWFNRRSLQQSYSLLHEVIEGISDAIFVKDRQGRYRLANYATAKLLGRSPQQILGQDDRSFMPLEIAHQIMLNDQTIMEEGGLHSLEEVAPMQGQNRTYWSSKFAWRDARGQVQGLIGIARDITERKRLEQERQQLIEELQQLTQDLQALNLVTAHAISTLDLDVLLQALLERIVTVVQADTAIILLHQNHWLYARSGVGISKADLSRYDCPFGEGFAGRIASTVHPLYVEDTQADLRFQYLLTDQLRSDRNIVRTLLGVPLNRDGKLVGVLQVEWFQVRPCSNREIHLLEITAERCAMAILNAQLFERTRQLQERLQLQFDRMPVGCILFDEQFYITDWNQAAEKIFGYTKIEALGKQPSELITPSSVQSLINDLTRRVATGDMEAHSINENITKNGKLIICEWQNTPLMNLDGTFTGLISMVQDITDRQRQEEQLRRYAFYDTLTGLPKRQLVINRLHQLLATPSPYLFAILDLALDRFQVIKHSLGHDIAEKLLISVAQRLEANLPPPVMLARAEADEFLIVLEEVSDLGEVLRLTERLQDLTAQSFAVEGHEVFTSFNIGIVLSSISVSTPEALLRAADTAMYQARLTNTVGYAIFDVTMQTQALHRLQLDTDLRRALQQEELRLYYQPIVSLGTSELVGFEALARWHHPQLGMLSPQEFIPLAEESGLILPLGLWALRQACFQLRHWQQQFPQYSHLWISVNLSPLQLKQLDLIDQIDQILQETGLLPQQLHLEITETAVMQNTRWIKRILERLKTQQIHLSIDDFGTGYSSLSYLHAFPFDTLKIDRSFVSRLATATESVEIVRTILVLAQTLSMNVVAEGIETSEELTLLQTLGCYYGQGYLFSRPMDSQTIEQLIRLEQWRK